MVVYKALVRAEHPDATLVPIGAQYVIVWAGRDAKAAAANGASNTPKNAWKYAYCDVLNEVRNLYVQTGMQY